jgi:DnaK suppressor protein
MTIDVNAAAAALKEERNKLVHHLTELGANEAGQLTGDVDYGDAFADAGAATAERTEVLGLVDTLKRTLNDVDAALAKVDAGTYGVCESCGADIGAARMEFRPTSRYCIECKSQKTNA